MVVWVSDVVEPTNEEGERQREDVHNHMKDRSKAQEGVAGGAGQVYLGRYDVYRADWLLVWHTVVDSEEAGQADKLWQQQQQDGRVLQ